MSRRRGPDSNSSSKTPTARNCNDCGPRFLRPSDAGDSTAGLIDERIVPTEGMARLKLLYDGKVVDTFEAGNTRPATRGPRGDGEP